MAISPGLAAGAAFWPLGLLRGEGPGMIGGRSDPALEGRAAQPFGLYEDHVLHRPSGEVHLPDMVTRQMLIPPPGPRAGPGARPGKAASNWS